VPDGEGSSRGPGAILVAGVAGLLLLPGACAHRTPAPGAGESGERAEIEPEAPDRPVPSRQPFVRVGLATGADSLRISSGGRVAFHGRVGRTGGTAGGGPDPSGGRAPAERARPVADPGAGGVRDTSPAGDAWTLRVSGRGVRVERAGAPARLFGATVSFHPVDGEPLRLGGRAYRGLLDVRHVRGHGLVAVNQLPLEEYLRGVVPAEIGPRRPEEIEAVKAQAVAARTYAVRNLGRRDSLGFDVFGSVQDQVYGGLAAERPETDRAVRVTSGEVAVFEGQPIRAYYHSTGGGHTARVTDVWNLPDAPYLRRVSDRAPDGADYCAASPRYRWEERWSPVELRSALETGLEEYFGVEPAAVGRPRSVTPLAWAPHGRITELEVRTDGGLWILTRNDIRFVLRTPDGRPLRSTRFDVVAGPAETGGLHLAGRGFGHGIGMCQWGAIGRSRAGQGYREILDAYYPGTRIVTAYRRGS